MRKVQHLVGAMMVVGGVFLSVTGATAQVIGTFRWRFEPFCNVVTLTVIQQGSSFMGLGMDDDCGFSSGLPATATFFVAGGTIRGNITTIEADGTATNSRLQLSLATIAGNWNDNFDNSGSFIFNPTTAPGSRRPVVREAWAYVIGSSGNFYASSGNLTATHPETGLYCIVVAKRSSHKAAQATLAEPGSKNIVSVGTGHGSECNPLFTDTEDAIPVYVRTPAGAAVNDSFTIVIPAR